MQQKSGCIIRHLNISKPLNPVFDLWPEIFKTLTGPKNVEHGAHLALTPRFALQHNKELWGNNWCKVLGTQYHLVWWCFFMQSPNSPLGRGDNHRRIIATPCNETLISFIWERVRHDYRECWWRYPAHSPSLEGIGLGFLQPCSTACWDLWFSNNLSWVGWWFLQNHVLDSDNGI